MKRSIQKRDSPLGIDHEQTIPHCRKNRPVSRNAFSNLAIKFQLAYENIFERYRNSLRFLTTLD